MTNEELRDQEPTTNKQLRDTLKRVPNYPVSVEGLGFGIDKTNDLCLNLRTKKYMPKLYASGLHDLLGYHCDHLEVKADNCNIGLEIATDKKAITIKKL